jgi:PAS domain S-box-containing protein
MNDLATQTNPGRWTAEPPHAASAEPYADIVEASPSGLLQVRADGTTALANRAIEAMFGYDRAELLGRSVDMLVPERLRAGDAGLLDQVRVAASVSPPRGNRDIIGRRKDGSEFPAEVGLNPVFLHGEQFVIAAVQDISARHAAQLELERQRQELQRSNADLLEFAHTASHDLKAPLRGLSHLAEWITEDVAGIATPKTLENLELLRARAVRMQKMLDGLLDYAQAGRVNSGVETFETAAMVEDLVATLALPGGFTVELAGEMPTITTDRAPLERVLQNLIENAFKHHDRQVGHVLVRADRDGAWIRFIVSDDGPGIARQFHQRIFQMFQTVGQRDEAKSTGIGLAVVKKKVEMRGGRIAVESAPPTRGTRFVFTWPEIKPG